MSQWFRIVNVTKKKARLDIYDDIGEFSDWWTGEKTGIAARDFSAALNAIGDVPEIELHINSRGGSVPDGIQMYNELKRHPANVTVYIDGQAASIASIVAMAGDTVIMPANTTLWVHDPMAWLDSWGYQNSTEMRQTASKVLDLADDLDTTRDLIVNTYLAKAGDKISRDELVEMMAKETTITAEQAVAWGLADQVEDGVKITACADVHEMQERAETAFKAKLAKAKQDPNDQVKQSAHTSPMQEFIARVSADENRPDLQSEIMAALASKWPDISDWSMDKWTHDHIRVAFSVIDGERVKPAQSYDPRDVAVACKEAGFPALAVDFIADGLSREQVAGKLSMAREIRDMAAAAELNSLSDDLVTAALESPVSVARLALSISIEGGEAKIRSDHGNTKARGRRPNVTNIYDRRNKRG